MNIKIIPADLGGEIEVISSKSYLHRLLICGALAEKQIEIIYNKSSDDISATIDCLNAMGGDFKEEKNKITVYPIKKPENNIFMDCGESGSTLRFLIPVAAALGICGEFKRKGRLSQRPLSPLRNELLKKSINLLDLPNGNLKVKGKLLGGEFILAGDVSSQFISGLLMALPLCENDSQIKITTKMESRGYIDLTLDVLRIFRIEIKEENSVFYIKGGQKYLSPGKIISEADWSNGAFWLTAGAFSKKGITAAGLNLNSSQGDREIINILKKFGADVSVKNGSVTVKEAKLRGISVNAENIPDIVPEIALLGSLAEGKTEIFGAGRLKFKESDRLKAISTVLSGLGADIGETSDGLIINGKKSLSGGVVSSFNDHRIAMMSAIASIKCENPVYIENAMAVKKSYPDFYEDFEKLGGKTERMM